MWATEATIGAGWAQLWGRLRRSMLWAWASLVDPISVYGPAWKSRSLFRLGEEWYARPASSSYIARRRRRLLRSPDPNQKLGFAPHRTASIATASPKSISLAVAIALRARRISPRDARKGGSHAPQGGGCEG